ncbi:MAG: magnesium transporter [Tissierellia bacterium]|nr:magnesium transporter [Tissierellia bacterium]
MENLKLSELTEQELLTLQDELQNMNPVDLAEYLESLDEEDQVLSVKLLDKDLLAETFSELSSDHKQQLLASFSDQDIQEMVGRLDSSDLVDTIQELPANMVNKLLKYIDPQKRPSINKLLGYPQESVGSIMTIDFIKAKASEGRSRILDKVKNSDMNARNLELVWIVSESLKLIGFAYLADLYRLEGEDIEEAINPIAAYIHTTADQEEAAKMVNRYHLEALPVVDSEKRLVGAIVSEIILDVMTDEFEEDIYNLQGIQSDDEDLSYLEDSVFSISKKRLSWLLILMFTATITSALIQRYEGLLASSVALVAYIPVLMDTGGNTGSQATATVISSLARNEIDEEDFWSVIFKETRVALVVGLVMGILNFARIMAMDGVGPGIALTVSITLLATIVLAKLIGGSLPLIAEKFNQDPTVMAGPLITTVVDIGTLVLYFEIARRLLHL